MSTRPLRLLEFVKEEGIHMKKRLLTSLLVICLLVGLIPTASAASGWMSECKPYQYTEVTEYLPKNGKTFAIGGQNYNEGYVFYLWNSARTSQVLYNLKGEYSSFTFYAGHVDGTKQYSAQLEIYLDGTLAETVPLTPNDIDKKVTVNTDGVASLKIKMTSNEELNHYDITYGVYDGTFTRSGTEADAIPESNMAGNCEPYEFAGDKKNKVIRSSDRQEIFMGGDSYTDCLQFYLWNPSRVPQAKFNFGGKYDSISFLAGHIDKTSRYPVTFEFATDGKVVKKLDLEPDDLPVPVTISLTGVKQMIISVSSSQPLNTYDYYYGLGAIQLSPDYAETDPDPVPVSVTGVTLSKSNLTLTVGNSANLVATVAPNNVADKSVTWTSSSPQTAKVDANGRVTAVAAGTAVITATTTDGGYTATCRVSVTEEEKKVTGVTVSKTSLTMEAGQTQTLTATVAPADAKDRAVTWASSNAAVASVDSNGRVTALSAGAAEITVKTTDGGFTAACRVIVKGEAKPEGVEVHFRRANVYHQGQFTDVKANQWYTSAVAEAFELGLMKGTSTTTFGVNGSVTVAEAVAMAARIHCIYTTGSDTIVPQSGAAWYQVYLDYAYQNKIINDAYYNSDVKQTATRAQFAEVFANSLPAEALSPINNIADGRIPDVPMTANYAAPVYQLYRAGILAGGDATGTFSPSSFISRVEAAAIVSRMAESNSRRSFTL